jgi:hypothetical protein
MTKRRGETRAAGAAKDAGVLIQQLSRVLSPFSPLAPPLPLLSDFLPLLNCPIAGGGSPGAAVLSHGPASQRSSVLSLARGLEGLGVEE